MPLDRPEIEFVLVSGSKVIGGHSRSNEVKWGKHWCMYMKLGTVVGIGHTRFAAHVARPSGGSGVIQGSNKTEFVFVSGSKVIGGHSRSNGVNIGVWT